jgi:hypothetical protein
MELIRNLLNLNNRNFDSVEKFRLVENSLNSRQRAFAWNVEILLIFFQVVALPYQRRKACYCQWHYTYTAKTVQLDYIMWKGSDNVCYLYKTEFSNKLNYYTSRLKLKLHYILYTSTVTTQTIHEYLGLYPSNATPLDLIYLAKDNTCI